MTHALSLLPPGTQVVTRNAVHTPDRTVLHPAGAVGGFIEFRWLTHALEEACAASSLRGKVEAEVKAALSDLLVRLRGVE